MTAPKVSGECACPACSPCCMQQPPQWKGGDEHCSGCPMVSALGPEPSAVEGLLRAAEETVRTHDNADSLHDCCLRYRAGVNLEDAIAAMRRERGEEGR